MSTPVLAAAASRMASASGSVRAIGFSSKTFLPARSDRMAMSAWVGVGVHTETTLTSGSASTTSRLGDEPRRAGLLERHLRTASTDIPDVVAEPEV